MIDNASKYGFLYLLCTYKALLSAGRLGEALRILRTPNLPTDIVPTNIAVSREIGRMDLFTFVVGALMV